MREGIGREDWVVEDDRLGLATEEAELQFIPELVGGPARLVAAEPFEPAVRFRTMPEAMMGHGQEGPIEGCILPLSRLHGLLQPPDRFLEPSRTIQGCAECVEGKMLLVGRETLCRELGEPHRGIEVIDRSWGQRAMPSDLVGSVRIGRLVMFSEFDGDLVGAPERHKHLGGL